MKKRLHKITAILLLPLGIGPALYAFFFLVQQFHTRQLMEAALEKENLRVISIDKKKFSWHVQNREIKLAEGLFDVKEWKEENGFIIIKGLFDTDEDKLEEQLLALTQKKDANAPSNDLVGKMMVQFVAVSTREEWNIDPSISTTARFFTFYSASLTDRTLPVFSPPPQV